MDNFSDRRAWPEATLIHQLGCYENIIANPGQFPAANLPRVERLHERVFIELARRPITPAVVAALRGRMKAAA